MNRSALKMLAAITILLTLAGCASLSDMNRMDAFDETVKTYEKMVFWSEFDAALAFKEPHEESVEQPDMNSLKKVRITSYKVKRLKASADKSEVQQFVEIGYYRMDDVTVKTIIDQQLWVYNNDAQRWFIRSDLPAFD
jgi:hypothetical protein